MWANHTGQPMSGSAEELENYPRVRFCDVDVDEIQPARYLEQNSSEMAETVKNLDIKQVVRRYGTVIDTGDHDNVIDWIMRPASQYIGQKVLVRQPVGEKALLEEINSRADQVKKLYTMIPSSDRYDSRWNPMDEILQGVRDAAAQDSVFGDRSAFDDESSVKWWFYTNTEFFTESSLILLCTLQRASVRSYVHDRQYLAKSWRIFNTAVHLVSTAMGRCMAADYYLGPFAPRKRPCDKKDEADSSLRSQGGAATISPHKHAFSQED